MSAFSEAEKYSRLFDVLVHEGRESLLRTLTDITTKYSVDKSESTEMTFKDTPDDIDLVVKLIALNYPDAVYELLWEHIDDRKSTKYGHQYQPGQIDFHKEETKDHAAIFEDTLLTDLPSLRGFIRACYDSDDDEWIKQYNNAIDAAITSNNVEAIENLWQGVYWYDRDNPDYASCLRTAARVSNLKMFRQVLWAYQNYAVLNSNEPITKEELVKCSEDNQNIATRAFISILPESTIYV